MRPLLILSVLIVLVVPALSGDIHRAIEAADLPQVTTLLAQNPDLVNAQDTNEYRDLPLHVTAATGNLEIAQLLLDYGAQVDAGDTDNSTPLHVAAVRRQPDMVAFLLANGADPSFQDNNGAWSLSFAASAGDSLSAHRLIEAGARLDLQTANGLTLLHYAARRNMVDLLDRALAAGVDPDARTSEGETVLHWAAQGGQIPMIERLVAAGADVNAVGDWGNTPLVIALWRGQSEAALMLADLGADVNHTDDFGRTPLWAAAGNDDPGLVEALIARGADADRGNDFGLTPLHRAARSGHTANVTALLEAGATPAPREARTGNTPLHEAAMRGYGDIVGLLSDAAPNLNACNAAGETSLDLANRYGNAEVANALAGCGSRPADPPAACPAEAAGLAACAAHAKQGEEPPATALALGECRYWYLGHSGYAFQTRNHLLIFDYFEAGRAPDAPALCNGHIDPAEIAGHNVTVFATHGHGDHLDPRVFEWAAMVPNIRYVTGCPAETDVPYTQLEPRSVTEMDGMTIHSIASNDSGLGFLVEVDGVVIFHPGDHANRLQDFSGPYCAEIDWLAANAPRPDLAVMPVSGCGFGDLEAVRLGVHYAFETLQPRVFLPAHSIDNEWRYDEFISRAREEAPQIRMVAPDHRGDHFTFTSNRSVAGRT